MASSQTRTCWVIAGPNGAGKTTFAMTYLPKVGCRHFVNADLIAAGLSPLAPALQQAAAGRLMLGEVQAHVLHGRSFAFETTLAGKGYVRLVDRLRGAGWRVELTYLALPDRAMAHQRVAERVAHGGHDIPAADIDRRFGRSLHHLFHHFAARVDTCRCFMNNVSPPAPVFVQIGNQLTIHRPALFQSLLSQAQP